MVFSRPEKDASSSILSITGSYTLMDISEISPLLKEKKEYLERLFQLKTGAISVMILPKKDFAMMKRNDWEIAFTYPRRNIIFIMSRQDCGRTAGEWLKVMVHEMVHIFYVAKFRTYEPAWYFEGLACYLAGQKYPEINITSEDIMKYHTEIDKEIYKIGYNMVSRMLDHEIPKNDCDKDSDRND